MRVERAPLQQHRSRNAQPITKGASPRSSAATAGRQGDDEAQPKAFVRSVQDYLIGWTPRMSHPCRWEPANGRDTASASNDDA